MDIQSSSDPNSISNQAFDDSIAMNFTAIMNNVNVSSHVSNVTIVKEDNSMNGCLIYDFIIEAFCMGVLCMLGFAGNTLSMICLWKDKSKTATPFLLISLEIADTLFLVTVLFLRVISSTHQLTGWFTPLMTLFPYIGSYIFPCAIIAMTSTIYLTILVTVNRYISVCRPYEAFNRSSISQARMQVGIVWILCIIYNIPRFFEFNVQTKWIPHTNRTITRSYPSALHMNPIYQYIYTSALYFIVMFLVPLITLIILNYKLICALRETKRRRAQLLTHDHNSCSEDDITMTLIVVVLVFLFTQTPALITQVLLSSLSKEHRICPSNFFYYERISDLMVVANSASNFIIYCFCSKRFRQNLILLVCKSKVESPENSASHATNHVVKHYKPIATKDVAAKDITKNNGHTEITAV